MSNGWRRLGVAFGLVVAALGCGNPQATATDTAQATGEPSQPGRSQPVDASLRPGTAQPGASQAPDASPPQAATWNPGPPGPRALTEVAAAAHSGRIWVAGGLDGRGRASNGVFVFDPITDTWQEGPALPEAIHHSALVSDGDALWLIGGYFGNRFDTPTAAVRRLDAGATGWTDGVPLPEPRAAGAVAWDGTAILYGGGVEPGSVASEVLAQRDQGWATIGRLAHPREHLAAASDGAGRTFFLGGRVGGLDGNLASVDLVEGGSVRSLDDLPTARGGVAAFWWPSVGACLVGGESPGGTNAQVECISSDGRQTRLDDLAVPRHGLGAVVLDGDAWTLLGGPEPGLFVSDVVEVLALP